MDDKQLMIQFLIANKEEMKNKVVDMSISWEERMELYRNIQSTNGQIEELQKSLQIQTDTLEQP